MPRRDPSPDIDEQSPLIDAENTGEDGDVDDRALSDTFGLEDSIVESKSTFYLILLTLSIGGLQIFWSLEFSNGSPYLLSLGMSKALLAFVWLAGPLTGVLVQPYIGIVSDRSRISWGRRKPFMVAGTMGTIISAILLSYAKDIIWVLGPWAIDAKYEGSWKILTISFATILMWCLDFSINTAQASIRAFIVDNAPAHQQEDANAWASRLTGVGNVFGYVFGYLNLAKQFSFLGSTQFRVLCVLASVAFSSTVIVSVLLVKERNPQDDPPSKADYESEGGIVAFFRQVFVSIRRLSPQIRSVCEIQFFHWMGWFPFLFYITTYIGQLYVDPYLHPGLTEDELDALWVKATRVGTLALLIYAIVSFAANIILPFLIVPSYKAPISDEIHDAHRPITPTSPLGTRHRNSSYNELPQNRSMSNLSSYNHSTTRTPYIPKSRPSVVNRFLNRLKIPGLTLRRAWLSSQIIHALCMFSTFFIHTPTAATIMTATVGIAWSLTLWAPFALISADIARSNELRHVTRRQKYLHGPNHNSSTNGSEALPEDADKDVEDEEDRAGIILGLHNVAVSAPQIIATLISSLVFKFLQKDRGTPGDVSVGWTLRIGGIATLVAAYFTWKMKEVGEVVGGEDGGSRRRTGVVLAGGH